MWNNITVFVFIVCALGIGVALGWVMCLVHTADVTREAFRQAAIDSLRIELQRELKCKVAPPQPVLPPAPAPPNWDRDRFFPFERPSDTIERAYFRM